MFCVKYKSCLSGRVKYKLFSSSTYFHANDRDAVEYPLDDALMVAVPKSDAEKVTKSPSIIRLVLGCNPIFDPTPDNA